MIFVILFRFVPTMGLNLFMILWFIVIFFIKIGCIFIVFFRFKEFGMVHTYMNKLTGILIFIYPILNYFLNCKTYIFMIFIVATLTAIEEILIDLTMDSLDLDRKYKVSPRNYKITRTYFYFIALILQLQLFQHHCLK